MKRLKNNIKLIIAIDTTILAAIIGIILYINSVQNKINKGFKIFGNDYCTGHIHTGIVGFGSTTWKCDICGYEKTYGNTDVPTICGDCARITNRCLECGKLTIDYDVICKENVNLDSRIISNYQDYIKFVQYIYSTNEKNGKVYDFDSNKYDKKYFDTKSLAVLNITGISIADGIYVFISDDTLDINIIRAQSFSYSKERNNGKVILVEIDKSIKKYEML